MDKGKNLFAHIFDYIHLKKSTQFRATVYAYMDTLISDETPRLARIFERVYLGEKIYETLWSFLEDLRSVEVIDSNIEDIVNAYKNDNRDEQIRLCMQIINNASFNELPSDIKESLIALKNGLERINEIDKNLIDDIDMVALIYFSALLVCPGTFIFPY